jgi:chemotaxis signal transduction protein
VVVDGVDVLSLDHEVVTGVVDVRGSLIGHVDFGNLLGLPILGVVVVGRVAVTGAGCSGIFVTCVAGCRTRGWWGVSSSLEKR